LNKTKTSLKVLTQILSTHSPPPPTVVKQALRGKKKILIKDVKKYSLIISLDALHAHLKIGFGERGSHYQKGNKRRMKESQQDILTSCVLENEIF
jgi:hypothetical protein